MTDVSDWPLLPTMLPRVRLAIVRYLFRDGREPDRDALLAVRRIGTLRDAIKIANPETAEDRERLGGFISAELGRIKF